MYDRQQHGENISLWKSSALHQKNAHLRRGGICPGVKSTKNGAINWDGDPRKDPFERIAYFLKIYGIYDQNKIPAEQISSFNEQVLIEIEGS